MDYTYKYPRPAVTADCIVVSPEGGEMHVLLVKRKSEPFKGCWAIPGGFMNMDEDAAQAARRELEEETGVKVGQIMQVGAYSRPNRDPRDRVVSIAYLAYMEQRAQPVAADDASEAQWFPLSQLPPLAFDHEQMLSDVNELINPT